MLVGGTEVVDVEHVPTRRRLDLRLQGLGMGVGHFGRRREEARHHVADDRPWGIRLRHAEHDRPLAGPSEDVPETRLLHVGGIREGVRVVGVVLAVPEPVATELTRVLAGHHRGPRRNRDRGVRAGEPPPGTPLHQCRQRRHLAPKHVEDEARRRRVPTDHENLPPHRALPSGVPYFAAVPDRHTRAPATETSRA